MSCFKKDEYIKKNPGVWLTTGPLVSGTFIEKCLKKLYDGGIAEGKKKGRVQTSDEYEDKQ